MIKRLLPAASVFLVYAGSHGQSWIQFNDEKVFVENKGQYRPSFIAEPVRYRVDNNDLNAYFTSGGLYICFNRQPEKDREELERSRPAEELTESVIGLQWIGAGNASLIAEDSTGSLYHFMDFRDPAGRSIYNAGAFRRLIYRNLYPGIDLIYTFDRQKGLKYAFYIHPGADPSLIKQKISGPAEVVKDTSGNILYQGKGYKLMDHSPTAFSVDNSTGRRKNVPAKFVLSSDTLFFSVGNYAKEEELVIDPWIVNLAPAADDKNKFYAIGKDASGNVYAYGGYQPLVLKKYSPAGALLWTFTTAYSSYFGDLAVEPGGNSFITMGCCGPNSITKLNPSGGVIFSTTPSGIVAGICYEFWDLTFNCDYSTLVVAGGCYSGLISNIDLNTGSIFNTVPLSSDESRAINRGPNGSYYNICNGIFPAGSSNLIVAVDQFFTPLFTVPDGYSFTYTGTLRSDMYAYHGIVTDNSFIYTTDGVALMKRDINTGALIASAAIPGGIVTYNAANLGNSGITADSCGNIYAGSQTNIYKFNAALSVVGSVAVPNPVYAMTLNSNGDVLACGRGFVGSFNMGGCAPITLPCVLTVPLKLLDFGGKETEGRVRLQWTTGSGNADDQFIIERREKNGFSEIGTVTGKQGNRSYVFTDMDPTAGINYYRIKQYESAGKPVYSNTISVPVKADYRLSVHPVPVIKGSPLIVNYQSSKRIKARIRFYDMLGRPNAEFSQVILDGSGLTLPTDALEAGEYILECLTDNFVERLRVIIR
jgi:WD40 repeat protein